MRHFIVPIAFLAFMFALSPPARAYSVFTHESIVDSSWQQSILPALLRRFPLAGAAELEKARGYAYGGALIQDLGYFPGSDPFFSDLTHYVRSGDFVDALVRDSRSLDEYAFAIGALEHYVADNIGHPMATNPAVAVYHPRLRSKYGSEVTYEDSPRAHTEAEIGFDIVEILQVLNGFDAYGRLANFAVAESLLARAFTETYAIDLGSLLRLDVAVAAYKYSVSRLLPRLAAISWDLKTREVWAASRSSRGVTGRDQYDGQMIIATMENAQQNPSFFGRLVGSVMSVPNRLPLAARLNFKIPTTETQGLFIASYNRSVDRCRTLLADLDNGSPHLENRNLDTGSVTRRGDYRKTDRAYAKLVALLARRGFERMTPELRADILAFFRGPGGRFQLSARAPVSQTTMRLVERLGTQ